MRTLIVIPARYASTRLPGKPLALIAGQTMLQRVVRIANAVARGKHDIDVINATEDERIAKHALELNVRYVMTPASCPTGTDRAQAAVAQVKVQPDFVLNLQGDAPLTPPDFLNAMIDAFAREPADMVTPVTRLSWDELDKLRESKKTTPFSGTTVAFDEKTGLAHWFSKNIIPAIRKESEMRGQSGLSPVWRHIGLYGYRRTMLEKFGKLPEGKYEKLEGLEQLRVIEHGYKIKCVPVDYAGRANMSGVDSPEDIARAEAAIAEYGELLP
ncbi:MAG: 3-deoxy-manno-octulosonate cytidylyltransferase [Alphaproteobacteria bacterium]|nr:3-deoxy-manno-octulosonate cytidylyltransferase [Alphaproteobacteria bacterium]